MDIMYAAVDAQGVSLSPPFLLASLPGVLPTSVQLNWSEGGLGTTQQPGTVRLWSSGQLARCWLFKLILACSPSMHPPQASEALPLLQESTR